MDIRQNWLALLLVGLLVFAAGVTVWSIQETTAFAKDIGKKNETAHQRCDAVVNGRAPSLPDYSSTAAGHPGSHDDQLPGLAYGVDGYSTTSVEYKDVLGNGTVFRGGNARSNQNNSPIDNDPTTSPRCFPMATCTST